MRQLICALLLTALLGTACSKVPAGHVGIKVYLLGTNKGVDHETLGPGRYFIGYNEELYLFPVFKQNHVWVKEHNHDESITFQTREGLTVNTDIGIMYSIKPENVAKVFVSYRRGVEEVTDIFLRNTVRDAFNSTASTMDVEAIYGYGKTKLLEEVEQRAKASVAAVGIDIEKIYLIGSLRLPPTVVAAIDAKIQATQLAVQRENELRQAEAEAKKTVAAATGEANSILLRAKAEAESNTTVSKSLTKELVEYERVKKWNGVLPKYTGGASLFKFSES